MKFCLNFQIQQPWCLNTLKRIVPSESPWSLISSGSWVYKSKWSVCRKKQWPPKSCLELVDFSWKVLGISDVDQPTKTCFVLRWHMWMVKRGSNWMRVEGISEESTWRPDGKYRDGSKRQDHRIKDNKSKWPNISIDWSHWICWVLCLNILNIILGKPKMYVHRSLTQAPCLVGLDNCSKEFHPYRVCQTWALQLYWFWSLPGNVMFIKICPIKQLSNCTGNRDCSLTRGIFMYA